MTRPIARSFTALLATTLILSAGCGDEAGSERVVGEEVVEEVEEVDPALLEVLPAGSTREMLSEGRRLYVVCSPCHGTDARGTQLGPSLRDTSWIHIAPAVPEIAQIIRTGVATPAEFEIPMPVMGGGRFDEAQLQALATYVYALGQAPS